MRRIKADFLTIAISGGSVGFGVTLMIIFLYFEPIQNINPYLERKSAAIEHLLDKGKSAELQQTQGQSEQDSDTNHQTFSTTMVKILLDAGAIQKDKEKDTAIQFKQPAGKYSAIFPSSYAKFLYFIAQLESMDAVIESIKINPLKDSHPSREEQEYTVEFSWQEKTKSRLYHSILQFF